MLLRRSRLDWVVWSMNLVATVYEVWTDRRQMCQSFESRFVCSPYRLTRGIAACHIRVQSELDLRTYMSGCKRQSN